MTYDRCKCILSHIMKSFSRAEKSSLKLYSFYPCNIRFFKQKRKKNSKFKPLLQVWGSILMALLCNYSAILFSNLSFDIFKKVLNNIP